MIQCCLQVNRRIKQHFGSKWDNLSLWICEFHSSMTIKIDAPLIDDPLHLYRKIHQKIQFFSLRRISSNLFNPLLKTFIECGKSRHLIITHSSKWREMPFLISHNPYFSICSQNNISRNGKSIFRNIRKQVLKHLVNIRSNIIDRNLRIIHDRVIFFVFICADTFQIEYVDDIISSPPNDIGSSIPPR